MINRNTKKMMERIAVAVAIGGVDYAVSKINSKEIKKRNNNTNYKKGNSNYEYRKQYKKV